LRSFSGLREGDRMSDKFKDYKTLREISLELGCDLNEVLLKAADEEIELYGYAESIDSFRAIDPEAIRVAVGKGSDGIELSFFVNDLSNNLTIKAENLRIPVNNLKNVSALFWGFVDGVEAKADLSELVVDGEKIPFNENQRSVLTYMIEQWKSGIKEIHQDKIFKDTRISVSENRFDRLFFPDKTTKKPHPAMVKVFERSKSATYRLKIMRS
jgi:hypothetical protein